MKPDLYKMAVRTMERFLVVLIVAPILRWLFTGVVVVPMATIVCVMTAVVLYDVARFFIDTRRHMVADEQRERDEKAGRASCAPLVAVAALAILAVAMRPERERYYPSDLLVARVEALRIR
jgi:prolipoprotein diacylglyceryltransferase